MTNKCLRMRYDVVGLPKKISDDAEQSLVGDEIQELVLLKTRLQV
jgi:hypothetical protein